MLQGAASMSTAKLIPHAFWFRLAFPCRRLEGIPRAGSRGKLLDLPESCLLPAPARLDRDEPWAEVRAGWNPGGLGLAVTATVPARPVAPAPDDPEAGDGVQLWIDTRDARTIHRATRFCHRFAARLVPGRGEPPGVEVVQRPIRRAQADAPRARPGAVRARAEWLRGDLGWLLELFVPAEALHGFDPDTNRRLGFLVQVTDPDRGDQFLGIGREFPVGEDPSLWSTLDLRDP